MRSVADLRVAALQYAVGARRVRGLLTAPDGAETAFEVGAAEALVPRIDALRAELRDPMRIAGGRTPELRAFASGWGRAFLPEPLRADLPDVLVIVPHGETHDLPIHLVAPDAEDRAPLGARVGVTYASGRALFVRAVRRNPVRARDLAAWRFGDGAPEAAPAGRGLLAGAADVLGSLEPDFLGLCEAAAAHFGKDAHVFGGGGFAYTRAAAKAAFRRKDRPDVVCAAAHGWIDPRDHRMSGLLVHRDAMGVALRPIPLHGGRYFDFRDLPLRHVPPRLPLRAEAEILTAAELEIDAETECELALLLGCSAGWGRVLQGDEPASLAETWLKIGAASAIAPMWDSPLDAVRAWLDHFLDAWIGRGAPKALAMRDAMRRMLEDGLDAPERLGVMALRGDWL